MSEISAAQVTAAQSGDIPAISAIVAATDPIIAKLAGETARKVGNGSQHVATLADEFESVARCAVWELVSRYDAAKSRGSNFLTYAYGRLQGAISDSLYATQNSGADESAVKVFAHCLKIAGGDAALAERICQTLPEAGRRLGRDRANAARLAYQGLRSLDEPAGGDGGTVGDSLANAADLQDFGVPAEYITASDIGGAQRKARRALVNATLETLSYTRREMLKARTGFDGYERDLQPEDMPELFGITQTACNDAWRKGCGNFKDRFPIDSAYPKRVAA
jgi:hypothetical protein